MKWKISSLYPIGEYYKLTAKRLSVNILCSIFLISLCFCNVENPQSKNNKRNFSVFAYLANNPIPPNLNIVTTQVGSMNNTHLNPRAILLDNGKVLFVGSGAEIFDPSTLSFSVIPNRILNRTLHTLTKLQDGRIIILGGNVSAVEIYDSTTTTFSNTGNMIQTFRYGHTSTLLPNGKVLVTGGYRTGVTITSFNTAELYDPTTGLFTSTGNLNYPRRLHNATLLNDGTVLIIGGWDSQDNKVTTAEIFNPATGLFTSLTNSSCQSSNRETSVLLTSKKVFIADTGSYGNLQLFDLSSGNCTIIQLSLGELSGFSIALLNDGRLLLAGGRSTSGYARNLNIFNPNSNIINYVGNMSKAKYYPITVDLKDGRVLISGGTPSDWLNYAEIYTP